MPSMCASLALAPLRLASDQIPTCFHPPPMCLRWIFVRGLSDPCEYRKIDQSLSFLLIQYSIAELIVQIGAGISKKYSGAC